MKKDRKIGICPYCGWKTEVTKDNSETIGNNIILVWCGNESCQEEYSLDCDMKIKNNYTKYYNKKEWQ